MDEAFHEADGKPGFNFADRLEGMGLTARHSRQSDSGTDSPLWSLRQVLNFESWGLLGRSAELDQVLSECAQVGRIISPYAVNHSESYSYSFSWSEPSVFPRWRARRGVAGHKLVGHAEQVP
jgi:hypothetical protein